MIRQHCRKTALLITIVSIAFLSPLRADGQPGISKNNDDVQSSVSAIVTSLRSETLKAEAANQASFLQQRDGAKRRSAVDFFYDLKAKDILVLALNNGDSNDYYLPETLLELVQIGDLTAAKASISRLQATKGITVTGGTELQIAYGRFQRSLVSLLEKVTGKTLLEKKRPRKLSESAKNMPIPMQNLILSVQAQEPLEPEAIDRVTASYNQWLADHHAMANK